MAFEKRGGPETENKAHEIASQLDDLVLENERILEQAVRYMSVNARETLQRALGMASRNS